MHPSCEELRSRLRLEAGSSGPRSREVEAHVAVCADCAALALRVRAQVEALGGLGRLGAPAGLADRISFTFEPLARGVRAGSHLGGLPRRVAPELLDGWVVAALQAGSREDRVVRELGCLPPLKAPAVLGLLVRDLGPRSGPRRGLRPAPEALEGRVADDLIRLPRAQVRRAASRLGRRNGPHPSAPPPTGRGQARVPGSRVLLGLGATLAVLFLAWTYGPDRSSDVGDPRPNPAPLARPAGPDQSPVPFVAGLVDGLTGGLGSVERIPSSAAGEPGHARGTPQPSTPLRETARPARPGGPQPPQPPQGSQGPGSSRAPLAGAPPPVNPSGGPQTPRATFLGKLNASGSELSYRGVRRVELHLVPGGGPSLAYREEVLAAADGRFAVDPLEVLVHPGQPTDAEQFLVLQKAREGFAFRYRDFRVRDQGLFLDRYQLTEIDSGGLVAGRAVIELEVRRIPAAEPSYRIWVDQITGMVLAYDEYRGAGQLVARVAYESFELDPDLSGVPLSGAPTIFLPIDLGDPAQHPFPLSSPVAVPPGFELTEVAAAVDPEAGGDWVRFTYGDGLEQVFLLLGPAVPIPTSPSGTGPVLQDLSPVQKGGVRLWHFSVGAWSVVQGEISGRQVAALGKVDWTALDLLLQSAIETL